MQREEERKFSNFEVTATYLRRVTPEKGFDSPISRNRTLLCLVAGNWDTRPALPPSFSPVFERRSRPPIIRDTVFPSVDKLGNLIYRSSGDEEIGRFRLDR